MMIGWATPDFHNDPNIRALTRLTGLREVSLNSFLLLLMCTFFCHLAVAPPRTHTHKYTQITAQMYTRNMTQHTLFTKTGQL